MTTDAQVREFLRRLKAPAPEVMRAVFTRGGCYAFVEILQVVRPEAMPYQTCRSDGTLTGDHVIAFVRDEKYWSCWDITGRRHVRLAPGKLSMEMPRLRIGRQLYRCMTPAECRKARKWKCSWSYLVNGEPPVRVD